MMSSREKAADHWLNAKDHERLNSGVQSVLVKESFRPADLVERIRWLVQTKPVARILRHLRISIRRNSYIREM
jgi:hypothetical protein